MIVDVMPVLKVAVPALVGLVVGIVLLVAGETDTGKTVLLSVLGFAGIGWISPKD